MGVLGYTTAFFKTVPYQLLPQKEKIRVQERRLNHLLRYAKEHSEYYGAAIPDDLDFQKIQPINKLEFVKNFDKIVTDKNVTLERVLQEIKNNSEAEGSQLDGKYSVTMTSGSTGNPTIIVQDQNFQDITSLTGFFRILKCSFPIVMIGESGGFGAEAAMIKRNMAKAKFVKSIVFSIDVENESIDAIIQKLQKIGPCTIIGYTGVMTIVANKLIDKNVKIKEKRIFLSGEKCSEFDKEILRKAFDCPSIRVLYGCTEAGDIAYECKYGHLHIMSDCAKIEPVDADNNPVGYGKLSDKLLLTNLMNRVQPIIRYEVTDRIILHQGCPCGCKDDWLEIEGRANDNMIFEKDGEDIVIPSISLLIAMAGINKNGLEKFKNYQIAVSKSGHLKVTLDYAENADVEAVNREVDNRIRDFFAIYHLDHITCEFIKGTMQKTQRGKYKRIYMV